MFSADIERVRWEKWVVLEWISLSVQWNKSFCWNKMLEGPGRPVILFSYSNRKTS